MRVRSNAQGVERNFEALKMAPSLVLFRTSRSLSVTSRSNPLFQLNYPEHDGFVFSNCLAKISFSSVELCCIFVTAKNLVNEVYFN